MFQGQIVPFEETIASTWLDLVSSFIVECDGIPIHTKSRVLLEKAFWKLGSSILDF